MSKKPYFRVGMILLLLVGIGGGAYWMVQEKKEHDFWEAQKPRIEVFLKHNYKGIENVHFTETLEKPMSVGIKGYVNDDPEASFIAKVMGYEDEFNSNIMTSEKLFKLAQDPNRDTPVDQIASEKDETAEE